MFAAPIVYLGENFRIIPRVVFFPFPLDSFLSLFVFIRALQLLFIFRNVIKKFFPESIFSSFIGSFSIFQYVSLYLSFLYFLSLYFSKCDWKRKNFSPNQALIFYQLLFDFWIRIFASFVVLILFLNLAFIVIFFLSFILCNWVKLVIIFYLFGIFC